jgi:beta-glucanase (GH16 family)
MKLRRSLKVVGLVAAASLLIAPLSAGSATAASKYKLLWSQEFNSKANTRIDTKLWNYEMGIGPNGEKEYYTTFKKNSYMDGKGNFNIIARLITEGDVMYNYCMPDVIDNCWYTSARLNTSNKLGFKYGRMSARIKMPAGTGVWPAFWMLGDSLNKTITWPDCGEIDIVESKDNPNTMVFGTAHGPGYSGGGGLGDVISSSTPLSAGYHTYAIEWKKDRIDWYFDGALFHTIVPSDTYGKPWVFNQEFFLIMNLAMGGMFVGNPSFSQVNPVNSATMSIDWIRYYSVNGLGRVIKH